MALWLVRAGKYGEYESCFLDKNVICLTWEGMEDVDLGSMKGPAEIKEAVQTAYPNATPGRLSNWSGQIRAFVLGMQPGDWIVLPRKTQASIAVGEITGPYEYDSKAEPMERHFRKVTWINREVPRPSFKQDILYSFGAFLTICKISRNDAEARVRAMAKAGWKEPRIVAATVSGSPDGDGEEDGGLVDLAQVARDQISKMITRLYSGHGMARLVAAILTSQGYTTRISPPGPDKGVDILAAPDPLGFGTPRICIQVKSGDTPVDRPTLDQLIGVMQNVGAEQGLLVSWGGFRSSVEKEASNQFFRVRLWDADVLIENLLTQYDRLPAEIRAELPLKRIWTVAGQDEDE